MKKKYIIILVMMIAMIGICTYCNAFTLPTMSMKDMTIMGNTSGGYSNVNCQLISHSTSSAASNSSSPTHSVKRSSSPSSSVRLKVQVL